MAEDIAKVAQWADDAGGGDEVAIEDPPGGGESPQDEQADVDGDDAQDGRVGEGLGRHHSCRSIRRSPGCGVHVRPIDDGGGEDEGGKKATKLHFSTWLSMCRERPRAGNEKLTLPFFVASSYVIFEVADR